LRLYKASLYVKEKLAIVDQNDFNGNTNVHHALIMNGEIHGANK